MAFTCVVPPLLAVDSNCWLWTLSDSMINENDEGLDRSGMMVSIGTSSKFISCWINP